MKVNAAERAFFPEKFSDGVESAIKHALVSWATISGGQILKLASEIFRRWPIILTPLTIGFQIYGSFRLARIVTELTSYGMESIHEHSYHGLWKTVIVIIKYALPVIMAGATIFALSFGLPLFLKAGITILTMGYATYHVRQLRRSHVYPTLFMPYPVTNKESIEAPINLRER